MACKVEAVVLLVVMVGMDFLLLSRRVLLPALPLVPPPVLLPEAPTHINLPAAFKARLFKVVERERTRARRSRKRVVWLPVFSAL
jgi:hypothetical protein